MRKIFNKVFILLLCMAVIMPFSACSENQPELPDTAITHETEFGGAYIRITINDFLDLGFQFGDSVDVSFSNGVIYENLPFYNGYYVAYDDPLLIGYPGYPYIKIVRNSDNDLWYTDELNENITASVSLREKGGYLHVMEERGLDQVNDRDAFDSDESFANFRSIRGGRLKENLIYRSSSPVDDTYGRASYTARLMENSGIRCVMNLSDSAENVEEDLDRADFGVDYYRELYETGHVILPRISISYQNQEIKIKIADALNEMVTQEGPYLIHCSLGKDRSGFVCMLVEMLAGASYEEMLDDYMESYDSFYRINEISEPAKYRLIENENFAGLLRAIVTDPAVSFKEDDLEPFAEQYLLDGGMSDEQLTALKELIIK